MTLLARAAARGRTAPRSVPSRAHRAPPVPSSLTPAPTSFPTALAAPPACLVSRRALPTHHRVRRAPPASIRRPALQHVVLAVQGHITRRPAVRHACRVPSATTAPSKPRRRVRARPAHIPRPSEFRLLPSASCALRARITASAMRPVRWPACPVHLARLALSPVKTMHRRVSAVRPAVIRHQLALGVALVALRAHFLTFPAHLRHQLARCVPSAPTTPRRGNRPLAAYFVPAARTAFQSAQPLTARVSPVPRAGSQLVAGRRLSLTASQVPTRALRGNSKSRLSPLPPPTTASCSPAHRL